MCAVKTNKNEIQKNSKKNKMKNRLKKMRMTMWRPLRSGALVYVYVGHAHIRHTYKA